ncbi:MAG: hypothetical protein IJE09_07890 [Oscillospiraceae bacterium]|nr:hypothetical protein [Oscillospiraceae bacterium]
MSKQERLEKLLNAYSHHYDIERDVMLDGTYYSAAANFFLRDENYLISKKHVLSAVENHEYVYFHLCDNLTAEELQKHIDITRNSVLARVKPHKEHMSTFATLVVLADTIEPEAKKLIKKTRFSKYFRLALHGWMEYHIAAMEISTNSFLSNPPGRGARKILEGNFAPMI